MKRYAALGALALLAALAGCQSGPKVVATINGDKITEEEFIGRVQEVDAIELYGSARSGGSAKAGEYVMQQLITERVMEKLAAEKSVKVTDAQVYGFIAFTKKFPEAGGVTGANPMRSDAAAKREARMQLIIRSLAMQPLNIGAADLQAMYNQLKPRLMEPAQVRARIIAVSSKSVAAEVMKSLKAGVSFETLALTKSEDSSTKSKGGDTGFVPEPALPPALMAAIKKLTPNQTAPDFVAVTFPGQQGQPPATRYFLPRLLETKPGRQMPMDEVKPLIEGMVLQQKDANAPLRVRELVREFTNKADIKVELPQYSDLVKKIRDSLTPTGSGGPAPAGVPAPAPGR
ncbi:MAG: peptidyl-prolyl cis-trans isomerase [Armatimonadetes bacterium]|nr:peptidyl-prolyl cis-trans isomerase [Armatimonadota bacterium]